MLPVALAVTARLVRPALSPRIDNPRKERVVKDPDSLFSVYGRYRLARAGLSADSKTAVLGALAGAGITDIE